MKIIFLAITLTVAYVSEVHGHAALYEPPSRNSAWRFGFSTPTDYNDMSHNCGSYESTYVAGKPYCGVCGDEANASPKQMECPSGQYCKKVITRTFKAGAVVPVTINFNANHGGVMQFRLCPVTDDSKEVTWACLETHRMAIQEAAGKTIWQEPDAAAQKTGDANLHVTLPAGIKCTRCVFQWHWTGANYYGTCANGTAGMGCGPQQTYIACADIAIT